MKSSRNTRLGLLGVALLSTLVFGPGPQEVAAAGQQSLRLRASDAITEPGGIVTLVVRTYAPRPISQGQICLTVRGEQADAGPDSMGRVSFDQVAAQNPMEVLLGADTFSTADDALSTADLTPSGNSQVVMIQFSSISGTVNELEGSLAAVTFRAAADLTPGSSYVVEIDPVLSYFVDAIGETIAIEPREGTLTIRPPAAPMTAEVEGDEVLPGAPARIEIATFEPVVIGAGQIALRFNPLISTGPATVNLDSRHGDSMFIVDQSRPGLILVRFRSPNNTFSNVPGEVITVDMPTNPSIPIGMAFAVGLDPTLTSFRDAAGNPLPFVFGNGQVSFQVP